MKNIYSQIHKLIEIEDILMKKIKLNLERNHLIINVKEENIINQIIIKEKTSKIEILIIHILRAQLTNIKIRIIN